MYTGKLVRLREYRKEDATLALQYINDWEIYRHLHKGVLFLKTMADEEKWVESISSTKDEYDFAIEALDSNKYIGSCGFNNIDWKNRVAEIGIMIGDKNYLSKGYGTDALKILLNFIFEEMNIRRVKLNVYSFNERAIKCYKKLGFITEGILRQEVFREGQYHDEYIMGLFKDEFIK